MKRFFRKLNVIERLKQREEDKGRRKKQKEEIKKERNIYRQW